MRPVPEISTDILYSDFDRQDLIALGEAMGASDIRKITQATLAPDRVFYHVCLNGIQTFVKIDKIQEGPRALEIYVISRAMYRAGIDEFHGKLTENAEKLSHEKDKGKDFCAKIEASQKGKRWDSKAFDEKWNPDKFDEGWKKTAIEAYRDIRNNIESGAYVPRNGEETAETLTGYWVARNIEYKHFRDLARPIVEGYIEEKIPLADHIKVFPAAERESTYVIGGMASGKTRVSEHILRRMADRTDRVFHSADYLKYAIAESAVADGTLEKVERGLDAAAHNESSNALFEGVNKRQWQLERTGSAPNVFLSSIVLGQPELDEALYGGGRLTAHHLFLAPHAAIGANETRTFVEDRAPPPESVNWSVGASAKSLLTLTEKKYQGANAALHLYMRDEGTAPRYYGTIDAKERVLYVNDLQALSNMAQVLYPGRSAEAVKTFMQKFADAGYSIAITEGKKLDQPLAVLKGGKMTIPNARDYEGVYMGSILRDMAMKIEVGSVSVRPPKNNGIIELGGR